MKHILTLMIFATTAPALADKDYGYPCFGKTGDECAVLIDEDYETGELFQSAQGACVALGHGGVSGSQAQNGEQGPYIVVSPDGQIIKSFPKDPSSVFRFSVITHLVCRD